LNGIQGMDWYKKSLLYYLFEEEFGNFGYSLQNNEEHKKLPRFMRIICPSDSASISVERIIYERRGILAVGKGDRPRLLLPSHSKCCTASWTQKSLPESWLKTFPSKVAETMSSSKYPSKTVISTRSLETQSPSGGLEISLYACAFFCKNNVLSDSYDVSSAYPSASLVVNLH